MPKRKTLTVMAYPDLETDRPYTVRIVAADVVKDTLSVTIKHTEVEQEGRTHLLAYPLPLRPLSVAATLCASCGLPTDVGAEIELTAIVGKAVVVLFGTDSKGHAGQPVAFKPMPSTEAGHDQ